MQADAPSAQVKTVVAGVSRLDGDPGTSPRGGDPTLYEVRIRIADGDTTDVWAEVYNASDLEADPLTEPFVLDPVTARRLDLTMTRYGGEITIRDEMGVGVREGDLSVSLYKQWPVAPSVGVGLGMLVLLVASATLVRARRRNRAHQEITRHEVLSRENERLRVARELHDGPLQKVAQVARELPEGLGDTLRDAADDLRALVSGLRPPALERFGLAAALNDLADAMARRDPPLTVRVRDDAQRRLSPEAELAVYRVAQEALTNAARHGAAQAAWVFIERHRDGLHLVVRDDGSGPPDGLGDGRPDTARLARLGHLGLAGMAERAALLGGTLSLRPGPGGSGSELRLALPDTHLR